jgi:hypothetical protein
VAIVNGYCTLADVKGELRLTTTVDDARLERCVETASRQVDETCGRVFYTSTGVRIFGSWGRSVFTDDATSITLVEESADQLTWVGLTASQWTTNPRPPIRQITRIDNTNFAGFVRITSSTWGQATIPRQAQQATIIQAIRLFKRSDSPAGVLTGDFGAARLARIDPDVLMLLRPLSIKVIG